MRKKKDKKKKVKKERRSFLKLSIINLALYGFWIGAYVVCLIMRAQAFNTAQTNMALAGYVSYTVEVSSPLFGVLSFIASLLPYMMLIWTLMLARKSRKKKPLCSSKIILAVLCVNAVTAILATVDIVSLHMVFAG